MVITIYDAGNVYAYKLDLNNLPEWVMRWLGLDVLKGE